MYAACAVGVSGAFPQRYDTEVKLAMVVLNTPYGILRWSAYFSLSLWRLRLKLNRFGAYLIGYDKGYVPIYKKKPIGNQKSEV